MTDKMDHPGKGPPRPGDGPRRPYATLDLKATEIGGGDGRAATTAAGGAEAPVGSKPAAAGVLPPPSPNAGGGWARAKAGAWAAMRAAAAMAALARRLAAAAGWTLRRIGANAHLSHAAAGIAGAVLTLAVAGWLGLSGRQALPLDLARRLAALEQAQRQGPAVPAGLAERLAAADKRLAALEQQAKDLEALKAEQARLAAAAEALQARLASPGRGEHIAKLADAEKLAGEAAAAKAAADRLQRDLAAVKSEAAGLRQGLEALKTATEEAIPAKLAGIERDLQALKRTEVERAAGAQRVLVALEIASLKRALERGDSYTRELEAAKKAAGGAVDLTALDRMSATGAPTLSALAQEFKDVVRAALDAEATHTDASVLDRLMAGARSVVRIRKTQPAADDASVEATLARMEAALKDGNLGETLAQGKRLPPKAAAAAARWLSRVEARYAADRAVAGIEASLKSSLAGPEPK